MTKKEFVFLVWNTEALYNGHPAGADIRALLNRIGAPHGFSVEDALETYAASQQETLAKFVLRPKEEPRPWQSSWKPGSERSNL